MKQRRPLTVFLTAAVLLAAAASSASGATYTVTACADAPSGQMSAFGPTNTSPQTLATSATCPPAPGASFSGLLVTTILMAPNSPTGATASWSVSAPSGTTLDSLSVRRYFGKRDVFWNVGIRKANGGVLETCDFDPSTQLGCAVGSTVPTDAENYATYANLATQAVTFSLVCEAGSFTCLSGATQRQAWIAVYGATAVVDDPAPPQLGAVQGSLVTNATHGWHRGSQQASFDASDASGVRSTALVIDNVPASSSAQTCDFTQMQPCPPSVHPTFTVDLTQLADGVHQLRGQAADAADQAQLTQPVTLQVDNHAPTSPQELAAARASDGSFTLTWSNPPQAPGAPIGVAHYQVCERDGTGCGTPSSATASNISRIDGIAVPLAPREHLLRLWLEDDAGNTNAASAASVVVRRPERGRDGGGSRPPSGSRAPRLRVRAALQRASLLTVAGSLAPDATGTVSAVVRSGGRARATANARPAGGSWKIRLLLPVTVKKKMRYALVVRYQGDEHYRSARSSRTLIARREWSRARPSRRFRLTTA